MGAQLTEEGDGAVVPYLASVRWYGEYFRALCDGSGEADARRIAGATLGLRPKEFCRTLLPTGVRLSVPLAGGASAAKHGLAKAELSGHGNWRHTHLGAIEAVMGRAPFFQHLMPVLRECLSEYGEAGAGFCILSARLHEATSRFLDIREASALWRGLDQPEKEAAARRGRELSAIVNMDESMACAAMRLGREAIFTLLPTLNPKK